MKKFLNSLVSGLVSYLLIAFVEWGWNPYDWGAWARLLSVVLFLIFNNSEKEF